MLAKFLLLDRPRELFSRQVTLRPKTREDFEQEFKQKVHVSGAAAAKKSNRGNCRGGRRNFKSWPEAMERTEMGQEDANSQWRRSWDKILERAAQDTRASGLVTISESSPLTKDVTLHVKFNTTGLFSGNSLAFDTMCCSSALIWTITRLSSTRFSSQMSRPPNPLYKLRQAHATIIQGSRRVSMRKGCRTMTETSVVSTCMLVPASLREESSRTVASILR